MACHRHNSPATPASLASARTVAARPSHPPLPSLRTVRAAAAAMSVAKKNIDRNHSGAGTGTEIQLVRIAAHSGSGDKGAKALGVRSPHRVVLCVRVRLLSPCSLSLPLLLVLPLSFGVQLSNAENSVATLVVLGEDHTLGNSFRYVLAKNKQVDFVGYSIPHPSEMKLNMRIQTKGQ